MSNFEQLARRALAAGFTPVEGCIGWAGGVECIVVGVYGDLECYAPEWAHTRRIARADFLPDFSRSPSLGCLLAQVRDAWGAGVHQRPKQAGLGWFVLSGNWRTLADAPTEVEALVAAREAAP